MHVCVSMCMCMCESVYCMCVCVCVCVHVGVFRLQLLKWSTQQDCSVISCDVFYPQARLKKWVCVRVFGCLCMLMSLRMCLCLFVHLRESVYDCVFLCNFMRLHVCVCVPLYICGCLFMLYFWVCMCVCFSVLYTLCLCAIFACVYRYVYYVFLQLQVANMVTISYSSDWLSTDLLHGCCCIAPAWSLHKTYIAEFTFPFFHLLI